jgi:hypothetical protein
MLGVCAEEIINFSFKTVRVYMFHFLGVGLVMPCTDGDAYVYDYTINLDILLLSLLRIHVIIYAVV